MNPENYLIGRHEHIERKDWGVALSVSEECEQEAFRIRDTILNKGIVLDVALERNPHVTLFQGEFSSDSEQMIENVVTEVLGKLAQNSQTRFGIEMEDTLYLRKGNNNIFWNVKSAEWLMALHLALDEHLRALPEWTIMKQFRDRIDQGGLTPTELEYVQKYGVLSAGSLFLPHITIGKLANGADFERIKDLPVRPIDFNAQQLIAGTVDRYGRIESVKINSEMRK